MNPQFAATYDVGEPSCALCYNPDAKTCGCEARALQTALIQAETHMMSTFFEQIRIWVRTHAKTYITTYFNTLRHRRELHFQAHMTELRNEAGYYNTVPHASLVTAAHAELKREVDEDWRSSVQKYPEVLEYYYSMVKFVLPNDEEPAVRDPPLSALAGARAVPGRVIVERPVTQETIVRIEDGREAERHRYSNHGGRGRGPNAGYLPGMEGLGMPQVVMLGGSSGAPDRRSSRTRSHSRTRHRSWSRRPRRRSSRSRSHTRTRSRSHARVVYKSPFDEFGYR